MTDNFIDKTFTVFADLILKIIPLPIRDKRAFAYYRTGLNYQSQGRYSESLKNYYRSLNLDEDPIDRSFTLYNIGLIYINLGLYKKALAYYEAALELNNYLPQALNGIAIIYHDTACKLLKVNRLDEASSSFYNAKKYWTEAIYLSPDTYLEVENWLQQVDSPKFLEKKNRSLFGCIILIDRKLINFSD